MAGELKQQLREAMKKARVPYVGSPNEALVISKTINHIFDMLPTNQGAGAIVGLYMPIQTEVDANQIMDGLAKKVDDSLKQVRFALPRVVAPDQPLDFHLVERGDRMVANKQIKGLKEPSPDRPKARPDILVVPLLAFDMEGNRLGYGGGYYDRTIYRLRNDGVGKVEVIGVGYNHLLIKHVPTDPRDQKLDQMITETLTLDFSKMRFNRHER